MIRVSNRIIRLLAVAMLVGSVLLTILPALSVSARGTCWAGVLYGDAGTTHNYVEFRVNANAQDWHVEREWWAFFPIDLWAYPDGNGVARAGISGTDWNPPYSPGGYRICTGR